MAQMTCQTSLNASVCPHKVTHNRAPTHAFCLHVQHFPTSHSFILSLLDFSKLKKLDLHNHVSSSYRNTLEEVLRGRENESMERSVPLTLYRMPYLIDKPPGHLLLCLLTFTLRKYYLHSGL